jgi:hypothetical protein
MRVVPGETAASRSDGIGSQDPPAMTIDDHVHREGREREEEGDDMILSDVPSSSYPISF